MLKDARDRQTEYEYVVSLAYALGLRKMMKWILNHQSSIPKRLDSMCDWAMVSTHYARTSLTIELNGCMLNIICTCLYRLKAVIMMVADEGRKKNLSQTKLSSPVF